jgi:lipopolysaccharide export system protein LptC
MFKKSRIIMAITVILLIFAAYFYFKYYFTEEQKNITQRKIETITGQNLTVTVFGFDGRVIKRWTGVRKITSFKDERNYTFFYSKDGKYVQIPDSVWYIAEEE